MSPRAIEDTNDGTVLIIESDKIIKVVENWGFENGYKYVGFRRLSTETTTQWEAAYSQYGGYSESKTIYLSRVLVKGFNNIENLPEYFNLVEIPLEKNTELSKSGFIALVAVGTIAVIGLLSWGIVALAFM